MRRLLLWLIRTYQCVCAPLRLGHCRFVPSCADYAAEAFVRFGGWHGGWVTLRRLLRCQPLSPGGFDPVAPIPTEKH